MQVCHPPSSSKSQTRDNVTNTIYHRPIVDIHKLPKKVRDHDMYILPKLTTKFTKMVKYIRKVPKMAKKNHQSFPICLKTL